MTDSVFHYCIPGRAAGYRPGAHAGQAAGAGNVFKAHLRLFDHPDPRRLDLRASLRSGRDEWLVRSYEQRASIAVYAVVDVSASMAVGAPLRKLDVAAQFVEAMGNSAFRLGDAAGMCAFDGEARADLFQPARRARGAAQAMATLLGQCRPAPPGRSRRCGLAQALAPLAGRRALIFLVSDFHWALDELARALDLLDRAWVVPLVVWDASELMPPAGTGFMRMRDAEDGRHRPIWINDAYRDKWKAGIRERRHALDALFTRRQLLPVYLSGGFRAEQLSRHFLEAFA